MKTSALIVFKFPQYWNELYVQTISHQYDVHKLFADEIISTKGTRFLIEKINHAIVEHACDVVFLDVDFYPAIDGSLIRQLNISKKVLCTFDDIVFHQRNSITASLGHCDLVVTADPLSVLKYEELMINAALLFHDSNVPTSNNEVPEKTTDVLFFGDIDIGNRAEYVAYLKENGVDVRIVGGKTPVPQEDLIIEIKKAKIVLNLSQSFNSDEVRSKYSLISPFSTFMQLKLRILEAGLLHVAVISEYAPAIKLMFSDQELPTFHNKRECLEGIERLLANPELLQSYANRLHKVTIEQYEASVLMQNVARKLKAAPLANFPIHVPVNYYTDTIKHRMLLAHYSQSIRVVFSELHNFDYPDSFLSNKNIKIYCAGLDIACKFAWSIAIRKLRKNVKKLIIRN